VKSKSPSKHYVVWKGRQPGIYTTWADCSAQVTGFAGAEYKAFGSRTEAESAYRARYEDYKGRSASPRASARIPADLAALGVVVPAYAVDAACEGNPGPLEFRGVDLATGEIIFKQGPFQNGTNNIGEFLAVVEALSLCQARGLTIPIYSDSANAIGWVRGKVCRTNLKPSDRNAALFERIARAERWLAENAYANPVLKWDTERWGEIPADYGRK